MSEFNSDEKIHTETKCKRTSEVGDLKAEIKLLEAENAALNEIKRTLLRRIDLLELYNSEITKLKRANEIMKGALKEISMYGISEPNTQGKIAIEALTEIEGIK